MPKRISILFGAGAEVAYGMPAGGRFALEIFRRELEAERDLFNTMRASVDPRSSYATSWLPSGYQTKRISVFGKAEKTVIFESSLEYRRAAIRQALEAYDDTARDVLRAAGVTGIQIGVKFQAFAGVPIGERTYTHLVQLNQSLARGNSLFSSYYFSAALDVLKQQPGLTRLKKLILATLQLYIGSLGQDLVASLNEELFVRAPEDMPVFDDLSGIFRLEYGQAGLSAFETILEETPGPFDLEGPCEAVFERLVFGVLDAVLATCLDYQALVDGHYRYLYNPHEWAKFCKISIFLHSVRSYMAALEAHALAGVGGRAGYYHDLLPAVTRGHVALRGIGTVNYTGLLDAVMAGAGIEARGLFLNGSLREYYDPYRNEIVPFDPEAVAEQRRFLVPFLFTQSGVKPLTSVEMSRRYVEFYDLMQDSDAVVVVGFGFNGDDSHINGMIRAMIDRTAVPVLICDYAASGLAAYDAEARRRELVRKIRVDRRDAIQLIPVDAERRTPDGVLWIDRVLAHLAEERGAAAD